jgi:hypothetical protein
LVQFQVQFLIHSKSLFSLNKFLLPLRVCLHFAELANYVERGEMDLSPTAVKELIASYPCLEALRKGKIESVTDIPLLTMPIPYDVFYADYLVANRPAILGQWSTEDWLCRRTWRKSDGSIQWDILAELFGKCLFHYTEINSEV